MEDSEHAYPPPITQVGLALIAVGTGLVVFLAGVCVIVAVGKQVPGELWSAGSALSGGLLGILAPSPSSAVAAKATAAPAPQVAAPAAVAGAAPKVGAASPAKTPSFGELLKAFGTDAVNNRTVAALLLVFAAAILVPLLTSASESAELHALAAGSGAALLGMLASSPTSPTK
jgi:hypothetical protein